MRLEIYYDGWCPVCTAAAARLRRLDWLGRLSFHSIRDEAAVQASGIPPAELERRMYARNPATGATAGGIDAIAAIAARLPLLMPLWPFVRLSGLIGVGQPLYDWMASRRTIVPVGHCTDGACSLPRRDEP